MRVSPTQSAQRSDDVTFLASDWIRRLLILVRLYKFLFAPFICAGGTDIDIRYVKVQPLFFLVGGDVSVSMFFV